jgi:hypothetical protein
MRQGQERINIVTSDILSDGRIEVLSELIRAGQLKSSARSD